VHRLHLGVVVIEALQRSDREKLAVETEAEEGHRGIEQAYQIQRVGILGWGLRPRELEMALKQATDVAGPRILN
jgi:hypothetical protein